MAGFGKDSPALLYYWDPDVAAANPLLAAAASAAAASAAASAGTINLGGSADGGLPLASAAMGTPSAERELRSTRRAERVARRGNLSASLAAAATPYQSALREDGGSLGDAAFGAALSAIGGAAEGLNNSRRRATVAMKAIGKGFEGEENRRKALAAEARAQQAVK